MKKILVTALVMAVVIGAIWIWKPWETGEGVSETHQPGENQVPPESEVIHVPRGKARFLYDAAFWYENSEHRKSLENVYIAFPAPRVDNSFSGVRCSSNGWVLRYVDSENNIYPEMLYRAASDNLIVNQFMGDRTTQLEILQGPTVFTEGGRFIVQYQLSELYPKERFAVSDTILVDDENADDLTLEVAGENQRSVAIYDVAENKIIDLCFDVGFMGKIDDQYKTEYFFGHYENVGVGWYWLYPLRGLDIDRYLQLWGAA